MGSRQSVAQAPRPRIASSVVLDNCEASQSSMPSLDVRQMSQIGNDLLSRVFSSSSSSSHHQQQSSSGDGPGARPTPSSPFAGPSSGDGHLAAAVGGGAGHSSSDSSDPDADLSATATVTSSLGMPSLDRLFRLCSTNNSSHADAAVFLPSVAFRYFDMKCPVCHKLIPSDEVECHLVMCLTRPRITYNEEVLKEDKGECVICLEDMTENEVIARLPCLCIYHKKCIDAWFRVSNTCPEHPGD